MRREHGFHLIPIFFLNKKLSIKLSHTLLKWEKSLRSSSHW